MLGKEFDGVLGCDYFSAYRKYMRLNENVIVQFCLSHLIRDVKFLMTLPGKKDQAYGTRLREALRALEAVGVQVERHGTVVGVRGGQRLAGQSLDVPGDISSAAFWMSTTLSIGFDGVSIHTIRGGAPPVRAAATASRSRRSIASVATP